MENCVLSPGHPLGNPVSADHFPPVLLREVRVLFKTLEVYLYDDALN